MIKRDYFVPEIKELEIHSEGMLAASVFGLTDYESNGDAIEIEI